MNKLIKSVFTVTVCSLIAIYLITATATTTLAQSVGISGSAITPDAQSILDIQTTAKGVLLPRMTTAQRDAIGATNSSDYGLLIFNTTTSTYDYWDGSAWQQVGTGTGTGNASTLDEAYDNSGSGLGRTITADAGAVEINGADGLTVNGNIGIGTLIPTQKLHVIGNVKATGSGEFAGNITLLGNNRDLISADNFDIKSTSNIEIQIDSDVNTNNSEFNVLNGASAQVMRLQEDGNITFSGLGGGGDRLVFTDNTGLLYGSANIPAGDNDYVQNQFSAAQTTANFWISNDGRIDAGLTVGDGITIDNNNTNTGTIANGALAFGNSSGEGIGSKRNTGGNQYGLDFYTNSTNRMAITSAGNVGIGTTTPDAKLNVGDANGATIYLTREDNTTITDDVLGSLLFDSTDDTAPSDNDASAVIRGHASRYHSNTNKGGYLTFLTKDDVPNTTAATERMRITANGNVGVGNSSPAAKLHVGAGNGDGVLLGNYNSQLGWDGTGNAPELALRFTGYRDVVNNFAGAKIAGIRTNLCCSGLSQGMELAFFTQEVQATGAGDGNLTERLRIGNGGNIGMGTSTPAQKLHVVGTGRFTYLGGAGDKFVYTNNSGDLLRSTSAIDPNSLVDGVGAANRVTYWSDANTLTSNAEFLYGSTGNLSVINPESTTAEIRLGAAWDRPGVYSSQELQLFSDVTGIIFGDSNVERMRMTAAGNLGIGTTGPTAKLEVRASGNNNPANNGILIYNPDVGGDDDDAIITARVNGVSAGDAFFSMDINGVTGWAVGLDNSDGDKLKFGNSWSDPGTNTRMTIETGGNVGIGITAPAAQLQIADIFGAGGRNLQVGDDTYFSDIDVSDMVGLYGAANSDRGGIRLGSDNSYIFGDNGNIGIGTTGPIQTLDVNGRINVTNGVIQRGGAAITGTSDLGLYSRVSGNWMRFVTNNANVNFFSDDNIGSSVNVSIQANGILEAQKGFKTERHIRFYKRSRNNGQGGTDNLGNYDFCYLAGVAFRNSDSYQDEDDDYQCNVFTTDINGSAEQNEGENEDFSANFSYNTRPYWKLYSECYQDCSNSTCTAMCISFDY